MDTSISRLVAADPGALFELVANVEDWPRRLPHYRSVRRLDSAAQQRVFEMRAYRPIVDGLKLPLRWTAIQTLEPESGRIEFRHTAGISRGMWVLWTVEAGTHANQARVTLRHVFRPAWPVPDALLYLVVGEYVVNGVARRTLKLLAQQAQRTS